jgi:hypothetical protein
MTTAANSVVAAVVKASATTTPISFNGDGTLFALNLFLAVAFTSLAVMMVGRFAQALWISRRRDHLRDPVTIWRISWMCASMALAMRAGIEAAELLAWSPHDPVLSARVILAKRWILPASTIFTGVWMVLLVLSWKAIEAQLRQQPLPVRMWERVGFLVRPAAAVALSAVLAVGVVATR